MDPPISCRLSVDPNNRTSHNPLSSVESRCVCVIFKMGFGDFDSLCEKAPLPLCSLVGPPSSISGSTGIIPNCYARNIELANTIIFEGASCFLHIIALGMTVIMILHIRSKFTAVGKCPHIMSLCMRGAGVKWPPENRTSFTNIMLSQVAKKLLRSFTFTWL